MTDVPSLVAVALATWRISHILVRENGPWLVFRRMREALGVVYVGEDVASYRYELSTCLWCMSVWVGVIATLGLWLAPSVTLLIALPFALSTLAIGLQVMIKAD